MKRLTESRQDVDDTLRQPIGGLQNSFIIQRPDPIDYYGGMLAVYMFHFLISKCIGQIETINDFPTSVFGKFAEYPVTFSRLPDDRAKGWDGLRIYTIEVIIWLSLGGFSTDRDGNELSPVEKSTVLFDQVEFWFKALEKLATTDQTYRNWDQLHAVHNPIYGNSDKVNTGLFGSVDPEQWIGTTDAYLKGSQIRHKLLDMMTSLG
ncbi:hypothetical protein CEP88_00040 (plasmid) [Roseobacter denitrificans]|uniref:Uncharacterized protein n=1 Tax=Roseobacter denitrificans (strain ATCC 33942 / OCh 114) TaxID=375451 RepID=Q07GP7_ROSDO|nr:hypothetical protein [Roseobacter denitrificans]ABI93352.1 hypothetical protein RD1_A0052 [Roseobacter denitrificans OCh 114]AVL51185.1 hypothetical protein CEP88_00040 [Roseobacter denitrificans]SFG41168.1 hypothetical protein SAMN05443635_11657 [Roseobacter denitrificans OCh 114]